VATFAVGQPIRTTEPLIEVDAGLKVGGHRFQLEVVTADGRTSKPDAALVTVTDRTIGPVVPTRDVTPVEPIVPVRDVTPR
jgi:hypothetical protein